MIYTSADRNIARDELFQIMREEENTDIFGDAEIFNTSDLQFEFVDILQDSIDVTNALTLEKAGFKESIKFIFDKIIEAIVSTLKFIAKIILFPFKIIYKVIKRITSRKKTATPGIVLNIHNLNKSHIKSKINDFSNTFWNSLHDGRRYVQLDSEILKECSKQVELGKNLYEFALKNCDLTDDTLNARLDAEYQSYLNSFERKQQELEEYMSSKHDMFDELTYDHSNLKQIDGNILESVNDIVANLKSYAIVRNTTQKNIKTTEDLIKELTILKDKVSKLPNISVESSYPSIIARELNLMLNKIRFHIVEVARQGNNISSWFITADKIVSEINQLIGMENLALSSSDVFDTVMGIPIYVNNIVSYGWAVAVHNVGNPAVFADKSLTDIQDILEKALQIVDERLFNRIGKDGEREAKGETEYYESQILQILYSDQIHAIVISEKVQQLKKYNPDLYNFIIGHEIGHLHTDNNTRQLMNSRLGCEIINNDELVMDNIGRGISGVSKEYVLELFDKFTEEFRRDFEKYIRSVDVYHNTEYDNIYTPRNIIHNIAEHRMRLVAVFSKL